MNIKTLLALCLFAFSPLAMANHGNCDCATKHHAHAPSTAFDAKDKICKDDCCAKHDHKQHAKKHDKHMAMSPAEHHDHKGMEAMDKTCQGGQCADMCDEECSDCCADGCDASCDCCDMHDDAPHVEHHGH